MKTIAITPGTHALLVRRKLDLGLPNMDAVLQELLGKPPLAQRVAAAQGIIALIARKYRVKRIRMFGSAARGEDGPGSDLDLLVDFVGAADLLERVDMQSELSHALACPVDLTTEASLHPRLRKAILAEAVDIWNAK